jgi:hypothetical protein
MLLVHPDGSRESVAIFTAATGLITNLPEKTSASKEVALPMDEAEISPEDAAVILGVSRPFGSASDGCGRPAVPPRQCPTVRSARRRA